MEYRLLGPVELRDDEGRRVDLGDAEQPMVRCVLAVLLVYLGQFVRDERLDRLIWGSRPDREGRQQQTRQKYITTLRGALKPYDVTLNRPDWQGYWISIEKQHVDLHEFNRLLNLGKAARAERRFPEVVDYVTQALALWHGPALADLSGAWVEAVRAEYDEKRGQAERLRFEAELELGPSAEQIQRFEDWQADTGPDDESVCLLIMAYCRRGQPDLAVKYYESAARWMKIDGRVPGESVRRLLRRVKDRAPDLFPSPAAAGEPAGTPPSAGKTVAGSSSEPEFVQIGVIPPLADSFQATSALMNIEAGMQDAPNVSCWKLHGLGGVGKTQLAAALARRLRDRHQVEVVVWIVASSRQSVLNGYAQARSGILADAPVTDEQDANSFLAWLSSTDRRWLVVLDDLDAPATMSDLWPPDNPAGRVLVTTRRQDSSLDRDDWRVVEVTGFSADEAKSYLAAKLDGDRGLTPGAEPLAAALGHLPLALSQAAAYLVDRDITCAEYQRRLTDSPLAEVVPESCALPDSQTATTAQTWLLSVDLANTLSPRGLAGPALELASLLDPAGVPEKVFTTQAAIDYLRWAADREVSAADSRDGLRCLKRLSLASLDEAAGGCRVRVHAMVQRVTRDLLADRRGAAVRACADALASAWPSQRGRAELVQAFRANALALFRNGGDDLLVGGIHPVLTQLGKSLGEAGSFAAAVAHLRQVHVAAARPLGPRHPDVLQVRLDEAYWLGAGGEVEPAARLLRALAGDCGEVLGPQHGLTFEARLYSARYQAKDAVRNGETASLQEARQSLVVLADDMTRVLGRRHVETMTARNDAGWALGELDHFTSALDELGDVARDREDKLGRHHHHTLITRNNIAHLTAKSGDIVGALRAYEDMLPGMITTLGPVHQHTLATRGNIARLRGQAGDMEGAVPELRGVLSVMRRELGPDHPITAETAKFLAALEPGVDGREDRSS